MNWDWTFPGKTAKHLKSNGVFTVTYDRTRENGIDSFDLAPLPADRKKWTEEELAALKQEFWSDWQDGNRRIDLENLIRREFNGDIQRVISAIKGITGRTVSERTVQAWLIDRRKISSRTCPEWALKALRDYLSDPDNKKRLAEAAADKVSDFYSDNQVAKVLEKDQVYKATVAIEADEHQMKEWKSVTFDTLPIKLHQLEKHVNGYLNYLHTATSAMELALEQCKTFEEFKEEFLKRRRDARTIDYLVREARRAIENRSDEFSNDEGLPG